jgi:mannan endo-1,4-beta-mannosidase
MLPAMSQTDLCLDGALGNHCTLERPWQLTSVAAAGMAGDAFWQHGDTLSYGNTHDDGFTKYYGSADWKCLVDDHVKAIG